MLCSNINSVSLLELASRVPYNNQGLRSWKVKLHNLSRLLHREEYVDITDGVIALIALRHQIEVERTSLGSFVTVDPAVALLEYQSFLKSQGSTLPLHSAGGESDSQSKIEDWITYHPQSDEESDRTPEFTPSITDGHIIVSTMKRLNAPSGALCSNFV
jgi:hypothetical protein